MTMNLALHEHPLRHQLTNEVHARPYEHLRAPLRATHLAVATGENAAEAERAHLAQLGERFGLGLLPMSAGHFSADFGAFRLRWERHTEFSSYTWFRQGPFSRPFEENALAAVPQDWLEGLPGEVLVALHLAMDEGERGPDEIAELFDGNPVVGSAVMGGVASAWTDFRIHGDGFGRILMEDRGLTQGQAGRLVQRLLEIETYRMMALLAFPLVREVGGRLAAVESGVSAIVGRMAESQTDDRALLDQLTGISAEGEAINGAVAYRLSAARAYDALVWQRIEELREERIAGTQTIGEFMARRLTPAMKTCEATMARLDSLSRRLTRAGALLRTRVDIALEEKNRDLLNSMNRRAALQLRLQETVEGLSVVAISYYLLGLVGYVGKGLKAWGLHVDPDQLSLLSIPVILGAVWLGVRRLRRALIPDGEH